MSNLRYLSIVLICVVLSGCGLVYKQTGTVLSGLAQDEIVPYVYGSQDLDLSACGTGVGQTQLLGSFSRVMDPPSMVLLNTHALAGLCSEAAAQQAQLHFERALHAGHTTEARDARVHAQRLYRRTAERRYKAYKNTTAAFGQFGNGQCPSLDNDTQQMEYLSGLLTSLQAILSDIRAGGSVGVPKDIAARAGRASQCLDNDKWWGAPNALQAVVWLSVPGTKPDGKNAWQQLTAAAQLGQSKGMPLASMLYAEAGYNQSDAQRERAGIKQTAKIYNAGNGPKKYRIFSQVAYQEAQFLSDELWTQQTGRRTPFMALGTFPGSQHNGSNDAASNFNAGQYLN